MKTSFSQLARLFRHADCSRLFFKFHATSFKLRLEKITKISDPSHQLNFDLTYWSVLRCAWRIIRNPNPRKFASYQHKNATYYLPITFFSESFVRVGYYSFLPISSSLSVLGNVLLRMTCLRSNKI